MEWKRVVERERESLNGMGNKDLERQNMSIYLLCVNVHSVFFLSS